MRPDLKPMGCSVGERGFYCDFKPLGDKWLTDEEARKAAAAALEMERLGYEEHGSPAEELLRELGRTKAYLVGGVEVYLEPGLEPGGRLGAIAVLGVSAHNPFPGASLVRINAAAFTSAEEMKAFLEALREAEKRDHRVIGRRLDLYGFYEEAGPGLVIFHPKGFIIREELIRLAREINERLGYREVYTPHVYRSILWRISGHYDHYRDKMILAEIEGDEYGVKPMNCPGHILIYKSRPRSYRDLPIRISEFGTVYRWEKRGELYGLLRLRGFTQDDGHVFLAEEQVKDEVKAIIREITGLLELFGFRGRDVRYYLSTRPEDYIGTEEMWEKATEALRQALDELGLEYTVNEGEGAFYGPKVDVEFRDSLGRWWQCSTIQVDFAQPERFGLEYTAPDGSKKRPVMVHRALLGSIERFMAILIEHTGGRLPTWLSPVQVVVLPTSAKHEGYAARVAEHLRARGVRLEVWGAEETLNKRIREAYSQAVPYIVIVGAREEAAGTVHVRGRGNRRATMPLEDFAERLLREIRERSLEQTVFAEEQG